MLGHILNKFGILWDRYLSLSALAGHVYYLTALGLRQRKNDYIVQWNSPWNKFQIIGNKSGSTWRRLSPKVG